MVVNYRLNYWSQPMVSYPPYADWLVLISRSTTIISMPWHVWSKQSYLTSKLHVKDS